jgi:hypothetical protein
MDQKLKSLEKCVEACSQMIEENSEPMARKLVGFLEQINTEIDHLEKEEQNNWIEGQMAQNNFHSAHKEYQARCQNYLILKTLIHRVVNQWYHASIREKGRMGL